MNAPGFQSPQLTEVSAPVVSNSNIHPSCNSRIKRCLDIVGALIGLAITGILLLPIAIAIRIDSPGSVFYSQIRCGYRGQKFRVWKFRSMVMNADALKHEITNEIEGHIFKNSEDSRITRVGRFLRRTSLDELPQFWNVLLGEMSLVGTRPPTPDEVRSYSAHHWLRLEVKPGMTGEWQVNGRSSISNFEQIVELDLRYQERWSVLYDLVLICRTIQVVFSREGAC